MPNRKPRYLKKETIASNLVRDWTRDAYAIRYFDKTVAEIYDMNKAKVEKHQDFMKKLSELHSEYYEDPSAFLLKYADAKAKLRIKKIIKDNPTIFENIR